jgi:hypothetical protein
MRQINVKRTNQQAVEQAIQFARHGLVRSMPDQRSGQWQLVIRWSAPSPGARVGIVDHLEPQEFTSDQPSDQTGCHGPNAAESQRIERALTNLIHGALERHPYGRLTIKIAWQDSKVTAIECATGWSHKVLLVSETC